MIILGISAFYHDSAVAVVRDGEIMFAAQEERFSRKKHDHSFPQKALESACATCAITLADIDAVVFYEKPLLKFDRLLSTYLQFAPRGIRSFVPAMQSWFKEKLFVKQLIFEQTGVKDIYFCKHHESHAASAFFPSPFQEASIITLDGVGEWDTLTMGRGSGHDFVLTRAIPFPHSLGLLYSAFTYFTGFRVNSGEYKLMGLAPYGDAKYVDKIYDHLIDVKPDGSFRLNMAYFDYHIGLKMVNRKFTRLFKDKPRKPESTIRQLDMDLAASIQQVLEEIVDKLVRTAKRDFGGNNLCLAGGVALNCVANGKVLKKQIFKNIWVQPAAGDAGGALGAALFLWHKHLRHERRPSDRSDAQKGSFLGPRYSPDQTRAYLNDQAVPYSELTPETIPARLADLLAQEKVVGVFIDRMEFGPRALGHRSIIGDARSQKMQKIMNLKIKFRESFRPFAPSVLEEYVADFFDFDQPSPYMLLVYDVRREKRLPVASELAGRKGLTKLDIARSVIPAVTHVDFSARIHSVNRDVNGLYYQIIEAFYRQTGCPVIINTSFNVRGEPIVNTPQDALTCFHHTDMDYLLLERFLIEKEDHLRKPVDPEWIRQFPMD